MKLKTLPKIKDKTVGVGDILVISGDPYLVTKNRNNKTLFDLMRSDGCAWFAGELTKSELENYLNRSTAHYSSSEYELQLIEINLF